MFALENEPADHGDTRAVEAGRFSEEIVHRDHVSHVATCIA
jgi:hypothetical protein